MTQKNCHVQIQGIVQGVGFRPTVYLYAHKYQLTGWVLNSAHGVEIELNGEIEKIDAFIENLRQNPPPLAKIDSFTYEYSENEPFNEFLIRESQDRNEDFVPVSPDLAICQECKNELLDPSDRRFHYPFINCTNCGPRFSIIESIPYDRPNTSMNTFLLCENCSSEYHNPSDRRFHAQPVACPVCGPKIWFQVGQDIFAEGENALKIAREWLTAGKILAVKGLGGFHLVCDAHNIEAVNALRQRKKRSLKPFAMMAYDLATIAKYAILNTEEETLLTSPQAPIVLLDTTIAGANLAKTVAPEQSKLGFMLPYTPLHILLLEPSEDFSDCLIMTSANLSEEPIAYENKEALSRLENLADGFLLHDRPIYMRVDDSVLTTLEDKPYFIRRARGFAPSPLNVPKKSAQILACGTHLKNTFCLGRENYAFISHFIGDLENRETLDSFEQAITHYEKLFRVHPEIIASDFHPDYLASRYALERSIKEILPLIKVQHHHAHIVACLAENGWDSKDPVIGLAYDGTGYGLDGLIWGGEILVSTYDRFDRAYHLRPVPQPGGDSAVKKPARMAISYLYASNPDFLETDLAPNKYLNDLEKIVVINQIINSFNAPLTSSLGRLFDSVASIIGLNQEITYEAQNAIALEAIADPNELGHYEMPLIDNIIETNILIKQIVRDLHNNVSKATIAARFHNSIIHMSIEACENLRNKLGLRHVAISGGVWQNLYLTKRILHALRKANFLPFYHQQLPPNDACVSYGQLVVATAKLKQP